jgi:hypothetical protein
MHWFSYFYFSPTKHTLKVLRQEKTGPCSSVEFNCKQSYFILRVTNSPWNLRQPRFQTYCQKIWQQFWAVVIDIIVILNNYIHMKIVRYSIQSWEKSLKQRTKIGNKIWKKKKYGSTYILSANNTNIMIKHIYYWDTRP